MLKRVIAGMVDVPTISIPSGISNIYAGQVNGYADGSWATGLVTTAFTTNMLYSFVDESGILRTFMFKVSASATTLPGIRRPDDYVARAFFQVA